MYACHKLQLLAPKNWQCEARFHPNFEGEHPGGSQGSPNILPVPRTSREDLRLDSYLEYSPTTKFVEYNCVAGSFLHQDQNCRHCSSVVKVTDSKQACHEFEPSTAEDPPCREKMLFKYVESSNILPLVWCGSKKKGCQVRCRPRHLTMVQVYEILSRVSEGILTSHCSTIGGVLATDLVISDHGQVTRTAPEVVPHSLTNTPMGGRFSSQQI
ncbi:uncharacterized protein TNCV_910671 [Trichonephila clavipes]|uniref:Uncharacterized protein n=1 Tax=Trichonephila clavipes TaxID=2585209 RepID=A0A8X7BD97_TRICX|nr:uncharacterized protein TNCV_910671 [Trichonephila clavipes]